MKAKRNLKTYRITDEDYARAFVKAASTDKALATRIEEFVIRYGKKEIQPFASAMSKVLVKNSNKKKK